MYEISDLVENTHEKKIYNYLGELKVQVNFKENNGLLKRFDDGVILEDSVFTKEVRESSFPGGPAKWYEYIMSQVGDKQYKYSKAEKNAICRVQFMVDSVGNLGMVKVLDMEGTSLAKNLEKVISSAPKWSPAMLFGKAINTYKNQAFTLMILDFNSIISGHNSFENNIASVPLINEKPMVIPRLYLPRTY